MPLIDRGEVNLALNEYDDKKGRHQSYELTIDGLDDAVECFLAGFGQDREDAGIDLMESMDEYILRLKETIKQLENIKDVYFNMEKKQ